MGRFAMYAPTYRANWDKLHVRSNRLASVEQMLTQMLRNKPIYQDIEADTKVPWWFIGGCHYREGSFSLATYLGNGEPLTRRTRLVPAGRGPFLPPDAFKKGAIDALKLEGFVGCVDWSIERVCYRWEGFNGYGYHQYGVNSPYLYGGTTVYGPPEARAGKYTGDHHFDRNHIDTQLGTVALLKRLCEQDASIQFEGAKLGLVEQDDQLADGVEWVQKALNAHYRDTLPTDGRLRARTMSLISRFQHDHDIDPTGLPGSNTIIALSRKTAPGLLGASGVPDMPPESLALLKSTYQ